MMFLRFAVLSLLLATSLVSASGDVRGDSAIGGATGGLPLCEKGNRTTIVVSRPIFLYNFELLEEPNDPRYLLFTIHNGPDIPDGVPPLYVPRETSDGKPIYNDILVARFNAVDGSLADGPVKVASNYQGVGFVNGPEFTQSDGRLGVLFAGPDGVHSVWREVGGAWNAFTENEDGSPVEPDNIGRLMAAPLAVTGPGRFPAGGDGFDHRGDVEFFGLTLKDACWEKCYGLLEATSGTTTDVYQQAIAQGFKQYFYSTPVPDDPQGVIFAACRTMDDASCGLFRAEIDGFGGLSPARQIAQGGPYDIHQEIVIADVLPLAGGGQRLVVLAAGRVGQASESPIIDVWTCDDSNPFDCQTMTLQARVPTSLGLNHFRTVASRNALYLHYLIREDLPDAAKGGYLVEIRDNGDGTARVIGPARVISKAGGVELVWASIDNSLRLFFATPTGEFAMCRLDPLH